MNAKNDNMKPRIKEFIKKDLALMGSFFLAGCISILLYVCVRRNNPDIYLDYIVLVLLFLQVFDLITKIFAKKQP